MDSDKEASWDQAGNCKGKIFRFNYFRLSRTDFKGVSLKEILNIIWNNVSEDNIEFDNVIYYQIFEMNFTLDLMCLSMHPLINDAR